MIPHPLVLIIGGILMLGGAGWVGHEANNFVDNLQESGRSVDSWKPFALAGLVVYALSISGKRH